MLYTDKKVTSKPAKRATMMVIAISMTILGVGSVSGIFAGPAYASTQQPEARKQIVRYRDLNLASAQGREILDRRIRRAAKQVCTDVGTPAVLHYRKVRKCAEAAHSKAWASAQKRFSNQRLAARRSAD